jgi:hypothetical protein
MTDNDDKVADHTQDSLENAVRRSRARYEWLMGALILVTAVVVGFGGLYLLGLWVDGDL